MLFKARPTERSCFAILSQLASLLIKLLDKRYLSWASFVCGVWHFPNSFPWELSSQRNAPYLSEFSSKRNIHFKENKPVMLNGKDTCKFWKHSMEVRSLSILDNIHLWVVSLNFKRILPTCQHFQEGESFTLQKKSYIPEWKRYMYPQEEYNQIRSSSILYIVSFWELS
jgi:hypothetical protein